MGKANHVEDSGVPRRRKTAAGVAVLAWLAFIAAGPQAAGAEETSKPGPLGPGRPLAKVVAELRDPNLSTVGRYELARQLLSEYGPSGVKAAAALLAPGAEPLPQQALVHALIVRPEPVPAELARPLVSLLGRVDPVLNADLAVAIGRVADKDVLKTLTETATDLEAAPARRRAAILALGYQRRKRAAEALIAVLGSPDGDDRAAATRSLACLTGIDDLGDNPQRWRRWWDRTRPMKEEAWNAMISDRLALRADELAAGNQVLEDRLVQLLANIYLEAAADERLAMLLKMLQDPVLAVRRQALELVARRLLDQGSDRVESELRAALVGRIDDSSAEIQRRAVLLLRDLAEPSAADAVANRLNDASDRPEEVTQAYLLMLARQPRPQAVERLIELLDDGRLYNDAAAALIRAADQRLLTPRQSRRAAELIHVYLSGRRQPAEPVMIELLGRVADDRDWQLIEQWLKHPVPQVAEAAARAWAESEQPLDGVLREAREPAVQTILFAAAGRRCEQIATFQTLLACRPADAEAAKAWSEALVKICQRIEPRAVLEATGRLTDPADRALRAQMLSAALEPLLAGLKPANGAAGTPSVAADAALLAELLLARAELGLALQKEREALTDLQWLDRIVADLPQPTLRRRDDLMLCALLAINDLRGAGDVAAAALARAVPGPEREARLEQLAAYFVARTERQVSERQFAGARQTMARLRQVLPGPLPAPLARRISEMERSLPVDAAGPGEDQAGAGTSPATSKSSESAGQ